MCNIPSSHQKAIWILILSVSLMTAMYQIYGMFQQWSELPYDTVEETVPKTDVPYPSVTICPEGSTLWPAFKSLLAQEILDPWSFPKSFVAFMRIRMKRIEELYSKSLTGYRRLMKGCLENSGSYKEFCGMARILISQFDSLSKNSKQLAGRIQKVYKELDKKVGLFKKKEVLYRKNVPYSKLGYYDEHEAHYYTGEIKTDLMTFKLYTYLYLMKTISWSFNQRANNVNIMQKFLNLVKEDWGSSYPEKAQECNAATDISKHQRVQEEPEPELVYFVSREDIFQANKKWNHLFTKKSFGIPEYFCGSTEINLLFPYLYGVYISLVHLQTFNFSDGMSDHIGNLMSYNTQLDLPADVSLGFVKEINGQLQYLTEKYLLMKEVPWSLLDIMDMLMTKGMYTMKEKATWNKKWAKRKKLLLLLSEEGKGHYQVLADLEHEFPQAPKLWTSLSSEDEHCFETVDPLKNISDLCHATNEKCIRFCKLMDKIMVGTTPDAWLKILGNASHPSLYKNASVASRSLTWLLPFCLSGEEIYSTSVKLDRLKNYLHTGPDAYGYRFCDSAKLVYTDIGLCTSFNFPDHSDIFSQKALKILGSMGTNKKWKPLMPGKTLNDPFLDGLLLIVDTWASLDIVSRREDSSLGQSPKRTPLESDTLGNFWVMLHGQHEVATFHRPQSAGFYLNTNESRPNFRSYSFSISAKRTSAGESLRREKIQDRQCMFPEESSDLVYFKRYSEANCLFECKVNIAKKRCNCVPWDFPRTMDDRVCTIFGNVCFREEILKLKRDIYVELGERPCNCYPDCKKTEYISDPGNPRYTSFNDQWLNLRYLEMFTVFGLNFENLQNSTAWDQMARKRNVQQYLYGYFSDRYRRSESLLNPGTDTLSNLVLSGMDKDHRVKNLTMLRVDFGQNTFVERKLVIRTSFEDMLSAVGGTIGIFTGFSIMTILDVKFWIVDFLNRQIFARKPRKKEVVFA